MKVIKMRLAELVPPEQNIRVHTEKQLKEFERSVVMFGQIRPIVVDENNVVLAGNGLWETLKRMGREDADVYKVAGLSDAEKKKLMIADNKIFDLGIDDLDTLNNFLNDLKADLDIPGFDEDILKSMIDDAADVTETLSEYGKISDEDKSRLEDNAGRKAALETRYENERANADTNADGENAVASDGDQRLETRKSVTCPDCGCVIWL